MMTMMIQSSVKELSASFTVFKQERELQVDSDVLSIFYC